MCIGLSDYTLLVQRDGMIKVISRVVEIEKIKHRGYDSRRKYGLAE